MTLSIVTINYNNLEGLRKTIDSVISQTWHDFEWIIIDGGSTDGSKELIEDTANKLAASDFNPLSYWCSEPDNGIYNAMNKGIKHCNGEYINCMNSGDELYETTTLEKCFATKHSADILYGNAFLYSEFDEKKNKIDKFPFPINFYNFYFGNICHQAMFVKTNALKDTGFNEEYTLCADYAKWLEMYFKNTSFEYMDLIICNFSLDGKSNEDISNVLREREKIQKEIIPTSILSIIKELEEYHTYGSDILQIKNILKNGGFTFLFLKLFLNFEKKIGKIKSLIHHK